MPEQDTVAAPAAAQEIQAPTDPNSAEYANWRLNGQTPDAPKPQPRPEKTAPVSETGDRQQERRPSKAEARLNDILADLRRAGLTPSELKTYKREARQAVDADKPSEKTEKPTAEESLKRPRWEDFQKFGDLALEKYQEADDKYHEELADRRVLRAIAEDRQRQAQEASQRENREKLAKAKERYGDGADTRIIQTAKDIFTDEKVNPAVKAILNDSDVLVDVMYVMGSKAEDLEEFLEEARTAPGKAIRRAVLLERLVKEELAKSAKPAREPEEDLEEEEPEAPPAKKATKVGPPPREAGGTAAAPPDEVASAVSANDARRYFKEQNRRDMQRRRTG